MPGGHPLISAILGIAGRTDATHAALTLAHAYAILGEAATVVRITGPGEARLPRSCRPMGTATVVERVARSPGAVEEIVAREISAAAGTGGDVVFDLPERCIGDAALRSRIAVMVAAVGATPLDAHMAAGVLGKAGAAHAWLLGCGRAGGVPATAAFSRAMELAWTANATPMRIVPATIPPLRIPEAAALLAGGGTGRVLGSGLALLAALRAIARTPHAAIDPLAVEAGFTEAKPAWSQPDQRDAGERLHDLADELQGIRDGMKPTATDLAEAPVLDDWRFATRQVHILTGRVSGHPNLPDGRAITTSDLYACDGSTFARTLSRYYRLGSPAPSNAGAA